MKETDASSSEIAGVSAVAVCAWTVIVRSVHFEEYAAS